MSPISMGVLLLLEFVLLLWLLSFLSVMCWSSDRQLCAFPLWMRLFVCIRSALSDRLDCHSLFSGRCNWPSSRTRFLYSNKSALNFFSWLFWLPKLCWSPESISGCFCICKLISSSTAFKTCKAWLRMRSTSPYERDPIDTLFELFGRFFLLYVFLSTGSFSSSS